MYDLSQYPDIMKIEDLMEYLEIGRNSAYKLIQSKEIRALKIGRIYRIPKNAVDEYMHSSGK